MNTEVVNDTEMEDLSSSEKLEMLSGSAHGRMILQLLANPDYQTPRALSEKLDLEMESVQINLELLTSLGLVKQQNGNYVRLIEEIDFTTLHLDGESQLRAFKTTATEVIKKQTVTGACKHTSSFVMSNTALVLEFIQKQEQLLSDFLKKSAEAEDKDALIGYVSAIADMDEFKGGLQ